MIEIIEEEGEGEGRVVEVHSSSPVNILKFTGSVNRFYDSDFPDLYILCFISNRFMGTVIY